MLKYFPAPYQDEWWYSVLCRYHVRSGHSKQQTTVQELFGRPTVPLGAVFPNSSTRHVISQLPSEQFPFQDMIMRHTLFPYYMRFQPLSAKEAWLAKITRGEMTTITTIRKFAEKDSWRPRYCPCCAAEERKSLGEPYWHTAHQIPLMMYCPVHGCPLIQIEDIPMSHLDYTFYPLSGFDLAPPCAPANDNPVWQLKLSQILHDYWASPYMVGITEGYSNLATTLANMGYGVIQKASQHTIVNAKYLYHDMVDFYSESQMTKFFGGEKGLPIINRACKWAVAAPKRYALLQCFAGIDSATMFSTVRVEDHLEAKLKELQGTGVAYTKKQVMEQIELTASQLDILTQKYGIAPFWQRSSKDGKELHKLSLVLDDKEYSIYKTAFQKSGYRFDRHFIRHCVLEHIKKTEGSRST